MPQSRLGHRLDSVSLEIRAAPYGGLESAAAHAAHGALHLPLALAATPLGIIFS